MTAEFALGAAAPVVLASGSAVGTIRPAGGCDTHTQLTVAAAAAARHCDSVSFYSRADGRARAGLRARAGRRGGWLDLGSLLGNCGGGGVSYVSVADVFTMLQFALPVYHFRTIYPEFSVI